jgi:hypothetical protein
MSREEQLGRITRAWTIRRELLQYPVTADGYADYKADAAILGRHGYLTHSSLRDGPLVVIAFVAASRASDAEALAMPAETAFGDLVPSTASGGSGPGAFSTFLGQVLGVVLVVGVILWVASSQPASSSAPLTACERAFQDAHDGRIEGNAEYDLDPAMSACNSLREWSAAWARFPPPGAGSDPRFVAENRCLRGGFSGAAICRELRITP